MHTINEYINIYIILVQETTRGVGTFPGADAGGRVEDGERVQEIGGWR